MSYSGREPIPFLALKDGAPLQGAALTMVNAINSAAVRVFQDRTSTTLITDPNLLKSGPDGQFTGFVEADDILATAVHASGNFTWKWKPQETHFNVRHFGARGDGVTDDQAAIQACINAATGLGAWVYIPPGDYVVGLSLAVGPLVISSGTRIFGDGETSRLVRGNTGDRPMFNATSSGNNVVIKDLQIDYNGLINTTGSGSCLKVSPTGGCANVLISGVIIRNCPNVPGGTQGVFAIECNTVDGLTISGCLLENNARDGMDVLNCKNFLIVNNILRSAQDTNKEPATNAKGDDQISIGGSTNGVVAGNIVDSPKQAAGRSIWALNVSRVVIVGNVLRGSPRENILVETINGNVEDVIITGNELINAGEWSTNTLFNEAICLKCSAGTPALMKRVTVSGNKIISPRRHGIALDLRDAAARMHQVTIEGNVMYVDRALTHVDTGGTTGGRMVYCDLVAAGQAGQVHDLTIRGNRSENCIQEGVYLRGSGILRTRVIDEVHRSCGQTGAKKQGFKFDNITGLHMESCMAHDLSGATQMDYGANFANLLGRVRIVDCDFVDTQNGNVQWSGSTPATWRNRDNWGAAALPA